MQPNLYDYISRSERGEAERAARLESDKYTLSWHLPITEVAEWVRSRGYQCVIGFDGIIFRREGATVYGEIPPILMATINNTLWFDDGRVIVE